MSVSFKELKSMKKILLLLIICVLIYSCGGNVKDIYQALPDQVLDWKAEAEDVVYDRETLYDYMNGGAEVYLAFDFQQVFVRKFKRAGEDEIILDIYDMGSPAEAFGVFSCDREDEGAGIGQDSEYGFGLLRFWKGRYFVSVIAAGDDQAAKPAIFELGKSVAELLGPEGAKPEILKLLPDKDLIKDRISFFHSNVNLNNRFFIASDNILNLDRSTDCVFAEYEEKGQEPVKLMIVRYPDKAAADKALASFRLGYMPEAKDTGLLQMENRLWTMVKQKENFVVIIFDAPDTARAQELFLEIHFE
jgi:hypothetical protein